MLVNLMALIKAVLFFMTAIFYFLVTLPIYPLLSLFPNWGRRRLSRIISLFASFVCSFMGVQGRFFQIESSDKRNKDVGTLFVSNHLSYIEILLLAKKYPVSFVTSVEMKEMLFLGQICQLASCIFVERRNKSNLSNEVKDITTALKSRNNVVIFPEATSTNGESVIRFRRPLFQAAIDAKSRVVPITVNYKKINDQEVTSDNRDIVFWYGDMGFASHLWNLFKQIYIEVELFVQNPIFVNETMTTEEIALKCHDLVSSLYKPIIKPVSIRQLSRMEDICQSSF